VPLKRKNVQGFFLSYTATTVFHRCVRPLAVRVACRFFLLPRCFCLLKMNRTLILQRRMEPERIVEALNILKDGRTRLLSGLKAPPVGTFFRQRGEKGLHRRILPTIARPTHADFDPQFPQGRLIAIAGELRSPIRVMQESRLWVPPGHRHTQRQFDQRGVFRGRHRPADDQARKHIHHGRHVQPLIARSPPLWYRCPTSHWGVQQQSPA